MDLFMVLQLLCGLALFLFGMNSMGDGLESLSGGKLEKTLEKMTNSTMKGFILGAAVTAVIQSSSATTVMVVGFVNSGIMKLRQAIGIIMGANIGTTVTSWMLSLTGISGAGWINLLKPITKNSKNEISLSQSMLMSLLRIKKKWKKKQKNFTRLLLLTNRPTNG